MVDAARYNSGSAELEEIKRLLKRGDFDAARRLADEVGERFQKSGNEPGQIWCKLYHADIAFGLGAFLLAEEESAKCFERFSALGSREGMGWASRNLQRSYCMLGRMPESMEWGQRALEIFDTLKDPKGASVAMRWMGVCHQQVGELATARVETISAMRHFFYEGDSGRVLECVHDLGFLEMRSGKPVTALRLHKYVAKHTLSPRWTVINVFGSIGRLQAYDSFAPEIRSPLEDLVPGLLAGRIPDSDLESRVNT